MPNPRLAVTTALLGLAAGVLAVTGPAASAAAPTTLSGTLEVVHEDRFDLGRADHRYALVQPGGRRTELLFDDAGPHGLGARAVRVTGRPVRAGVMDVGSTAAVSTAGTAEAVEPSTTKRVAVVLFDFADSDPDARAVTTTDARNAVFTEDGASVDGFLAESSYGQLDITGSSSESGDVFDWVTISAKSTDACAYATWGQQARALAAAQRGFVDSSYDQVVHVMPKSTCSFGGVAYMPGKYSWVVLRSKGSPNVLTRLRGITSHEYGHSLGIHHSGSQACTSRNGDTVTLTSCSAAVSEYGDPFSVMGSSLNERQYTAFQKGRLGWLAAGQTVDAASNGRYTIGSASVPGTGPTVLRVAAKKANGSPRFYSFELRTASGVFDSATTAPDDPDYDRSGIALPPVDGVFVRWHGDYWLNVVSRLYDMTPGSRVAGQDFDDAAMTPGTTLSVPETSTTVRLESVQDGVATLVVSSGGSTDGGGKGGKPRR